MEIILIKFKWLMQAYHHKSPFTMMKIPDVIEAMERRDPKALEKILLEHFEYFIERLNEYTMKKF